MLRPFFKTSCLGVLAATIIWLDCTAVQGQIFRRWRAGWNDCCCYNSTNYTSYNGGYLNQGQAYPAAVSTYGGAWGQSAYVADGCGGFTQPQDPRRDPNAPEPSPRELPTYGSPDQPLVEPAMPPQPRGTYPGQGDDATRGNPTQGDTTSPGAGGDISGDARSYVTSFPESQTTKIYQEPRTQEPRKQDPRPQEPRRSVPATESQVDTKQAMSQFLASKLILCNNGLIQCAQRTVSKLSNADAKALAQTIIQEHSALNAKLKPLAAAYATEAVIAATPPARSADNPADRPADKVVRDKSTGQTRTIQETGFRESADRCYADLFAVAKKAHQNLEEAANKMMDEHTADELDMAYVGSQMVIHQMLVAELKAMDGAVSNELQAVLREARGSAEQHLAQAKEILQRIKGGSDRNGAPPRQ